MKHILLLATLASLSSFALATKHAPLPEKLLQAQTAYIDNRTGIAVALDRTYGELSKWGHFKLVDHAQEADVVFLLTAKQYASDYTITGGGSIGGIQQPLTARGRPVIYLAVIDTTTGQSLWSDARARSYHNAARGLVEELRKRFQELRK